MAGDQINDNGREEDVVRGKAFHLATSDNDMGYSEQLGVKSGSNLDGFKRTMAELTDSCTEGRIGLRVI